MQLGREHGHRFDTRSCLNIILGIFQPVVWTGSIFAALSCPVFALPRVGGFGGRSVAHIPEQWLVIEPREGSTS